MSLKCHVCSKLALVQLVTHAVAARPRQPTARTKRDPPCHASSVAQRSGLRAPARLPATPRSAAAPREKGQNQAGAVATRAKCPQKPWLAAQPQHSLSLLGGAVRCRLPHRSGRQMRSVLPHKYAQYDVMRVMHDTVQAGRRAGSRCECHMHANRDRSVASPATNDLRNTTTNYYY